MVKLVGPLCSFEARGTIAKNLTFSMRKSGSQVRWQKKQKDKITTARTTQRDKFIEAKNSYPLHDFGIQNFGFFLVGGRDININSLPLRKRAPQFACFVRDFLS